MPSRRARALRALYAQMLRFLPRPFRACFGAEMQGVFASALAVAWEDGSLAVLGLCAREIASLPLLAAQERLPSASTLQELRPMHTMTCPRCVTPSAAGAGYCAQCGYAFLPARERLGRWLDHHPRLARAATALSFLVALYLAVHTLTEHGLFYRGSYVLWLLGVGVAALYFGGTRSGRRSPRAPALHGLLAVLLLAATGMTARFVDGTVLAHGVGDEWSDAFFLPGIELRASRFDSIEEANAFAERHALFAETTEGDAGAHEPPSGTGAADTAVAAAVPEARTRRVATSIRAVGEGYLASSLRARRVDLAYALATLLYIGVAVSVAMRFGSDEEDGNEGPALEPAM